MKVARETPNIYSTKGRKTKVGLRVENEKVTLTGDLMQRTSNMWVKSE